MTLPTSISVALDPVEKLARARRRAAWMVALWSGIAIALFALAAVAALDTRLTFSAFTRALAVIAGVVALLVALAWRGAAVRRAHTLLEAARVWERAHPEAGQRIRTALEVRAQAAAGEQHRFTDRLMQETAEELGKHPWHNLVPSKKWMQMAALAGLVFAGILALMVTWPDFRLAVARMLPPWMAGTYTRLSWASLPETFDERHLPHIGIAVARRPAVPVLHVRPHGGGEWKTLPLAALPDGSTWDTVLTGYTDDLEIYAEAGDARTPVATVLYRPLPKLTNSQVTLIYPDYTGLPAKTQNGGDLHAVEGSSAVWTFTFNIPPERVTWEFGGQSPQSVLFDKSGKVAKVRWPVTEGKFNATLSVSGTSGEVLDSWRYAVEGVKDELPKVEILDLPKKLEATPVAELPVRVRATDDFGVGEIGLVLEAAGHREWVLAKPIDEKDKHTVTEFITVQLDKFPLTIRDNVRIYAYALDHKPRGGPRGVSELQAIDIREFKKLFRFRRVDGQGGSGLTAAEIAGLKAKLADLDKIIKTQRGVVSDGFTMREESRGQPVTSFIARAKAIQDREEQNSADGARLSGDWMQDGNIPRDDVTLLSTGADQMHEAATAFGAPEPEQAFNTADRALTTLLQLRKKILTVILKGAQMPSDGESGEEMDAGDMPKDLASLAEEARRLAREENQVGKQIAPDAVAGNSIDATRRQQEIAVSDAGELYAALVDHPDRPDQAVQMMDEAERAMRGGDTELHKPDPSGAREPVAQAEQRLNELADFLHAMDLQNAANTLKQMAANTEGNKGQQGQQDQQGDKGDQGDQGDQGNQGDQGQNGQGQKGQGKGQGKGKGQGQGSGQGQGGDQTAGNDQNDNGEDKNGQGGQQGNGGADKTARTAQMNDKTLGAMADRAKKGSNGGDEQGNTGNKGNDGNGGPGANDTLANQLNQLRENSGVQDLARDAEKLAQLQRDGKGDAADANELRNKVDGERAEVAQAFRDEAARMEASRAAQIAESQAEGQKLMQQLADNNGTQQGNNGKGDKGQQGKNQGNGKGDQGKGQDGQNGRGDGKAQTGQSGQGEGNTETGQNGQGNGNGGGGKGKGKPQGPKSTAKGGTGSEAVPNSGGVLSGPRTAVMSFTRTLEALNDKKLDYFAHKLRDEPFDRNAIPDLQEVEKRLTEMLADLPGSSPVPTAGGRVPESRRREIEDYYRDLSDDLGDDAAPAPETPQQ